MISVIVIGHDVVGMETQLIDMTIQCLQSIKDTMGYLNYELIFIDNGSKDDGRMVKAVANFFERSREEIDRRVDETEDQYWDRMKIRQQTFVNGWLKHNEANEPVAKCWNDAIAEAQGDTIFLINNDIIFHKPGWAQLLCETLYKQPNVGAVGGQLMSWNRFMFLEGSVFVFDRERVMKVAENGKIFDEQFTFTCEEVDLCARLENTGHLLLMLPLEENKYYTHLRHGTLSQMVHEGVDMLTIMHDNRKRLCVKYGLPEQVND